MLVSLMGPPVAGKTEHAKRFYKEYPEFKLLTIDSFRMKHEEETAWYELMKAAVNSKHCIIETSGLSWRLKSILNHPVISRRGVLHVIFLAERKELLERLEERERLRKKPKIPFKYKTLTHEGLIDKCLNELQDKYPKAWILSTSTGSQDSQYECFKRYILKHKKLIEEFLEN